MDADQSRHSAKPLQMLPSLTSLRVFAALAVAVHHTRPAWAHTAAIDFVGQIGWLGVSVFFVLSGFILMWGYDPATADRQFILRRMIRIYPLHVICLLVSLASFVIVGTPLAGYIGTPYGTVANFLLVHDWLPGHPNIRQAWNGVSWTLSCELFFYLCAPFVFRPMLQMATVVPLFYRMVALWGFLLAMCIIGAQHHWESALDFMVYNPISQFFEFMVGACGALLLRSGWRFNSSSLSLAVMLIPLIIYCQFVPEASGLRYGAVMIQLIVPGVFLLILSIAQTDIAGRVSWMQTRVLVFFGEASFALYMIHALFLGAFAIIRNRVFPISNSSPLWGEVMTVVFLVSVLALSAITHIWVEQPIRLFLLKRLGVHRVRPEGGKIRTLETAVL
jgi:peptidoglycan/LPS O-acetylase OafA/YrhL